MAVMIEAREIGCVCISVIAVYRSPSPDQAIFMIFMILML